MIENPNDYFSAPSDATHFSCGVDGIYWPAFWKGADNGCWCMPIVDGIPEKHWTFHECVEIPSRAKVINASPEASK